MKFVYTLKIQYYKEEILADIYATRLLNKNLNLFCLNDKGHQMQDKACIFLLYPGQPINKINNQ